MRRKLIFLSGGILLLLVGFAFWFFSSEQNLRGGAETGSKICKGDTQPILFKRLSDERNFPFLLFGRSLSTWKERSDYYQYLEAISRFPDVRSCLMDSEKKKQ